MDHLIVAISLAVAGNIWAARRAARREVGAPPAAPSRSQTAAERSNPGTGAGPDDGPGTFDELTGVFRKQLEGMFRAADFDEDGVVDLRQFVQVCHHASSRGTCGL